MSERLIPNVSRIAMFIDDVSLLTPFVGCLYASVKAMGGAEGYRELLAVSGAGNRLCWRKGLWDPSNVDLLCCEGAPFAPHHRALKALGWSGQVKLTKPVAGQEGPLGDAVAALTDIRASIDEGIPVIAMGVIGPPECCIVSGYKDDGETLVGWNYFQGDCGFPPDLPFEKKDWYPGMTGYILLSPSGTKPPLRDTALTLLRAISAHARTPEVRGAAVGLAAWEAMLAQLEHDDFSQCTLKLSEGRVGEDPGWQTSVQGRFMVYCDSLCQVHERGVALPWYRGLAQAVPEWAPELGLAIGAWEDCSSYGGYLWKHLSFDDSGLERFRLPEVRRALAEEGRRCMRRDEEAISHIESLLGRIG